MIRPSKDYAQAAETALATSLQPLHAGKSGEHALTGIGFALMFFVARMLEDDEERRSERKP